MTTWTTRDERAFIRGLGTHVSAGQHTVQPPPTYREKLQRLKQYQQTIPIRHNWGAIDRADIEEFVYDEIERVKRLIENWEEGESTHA